MSESMQQKRAVKKVYRMDGSLAYGAAGQLFDIAILEVDSPFTLNNYVVPAKLPTARTPSGTNLIVSGWGTTTEGSFSCFFHTITLIFMKYLTSSKNCRWVNFLHTAASYSPYCDQI